MQREIETFRDLGNATSRRGSETHHVRVFVRNAVISWLERAGFKVVTLVRGRYI